MRSKEYFLDTTSDAEIFTKGAIAYIFTQEFTTTDYQYFKRLMASYNAQNEDFKLGMAREFNILYLCEYTYTDMERRLRKGDYSFHIG